MNQHIMSAYYDTELNDLYNNHKDNLFDPREESHHGIEFNNHGSPLKWADGQNTYHSIMEGIEGYVYEHSADFKAAGGAAFQGIGSAGMGRLFGLLRYNSNPYNQRMTEDLLGLSPTGPGHDANMEMFSRFLNDAYEPYSALEGIGRAFFAGDPTEQHLQNLIDQLQEGAQQPPKGGLFDLLFFVLSPVIATQFQSSKAVPPPYADPLALDLDGDGIETAGIGNWQNTTLFDHDGDGVRDGTGWLSGDDGWLVRDLNANGTIDTGAELFGDNTVLSDGSTAAEGFSALSDLDSNADGVIDASDAAFGELQVWQDRNQDGFSQA